MEDIRRRSERQVERDIRTAAERVAEKEPRYETHTVYCYLVDGVCQICKGQHPQHKTECTMWKAVGPITNVLTRCSGCCTENSIHYPDCTDPFYGGHGFCCQDIPVMTKDQLQSWLQEYEHRKRVLLQKRARPGFVWCDNQQRTLDAMELTMQDFQAALQKF